MLCLGRINHPSSRRGCPSPNFSIEQLTSPAPFALQQPPSQVGLGRSQRLLYWCQQIRYNWRSCPTQRTPLSYTRSRKTRLDTRRLSPSVVQRRSAPCLSFCCLCTERKPPGPEGQFVRLGCCIDIALLCLFLHQCIM
jgi:hypothetical protein